MIRTFKRKMYGYFHAKKTTKWIDVLQDLTDAYNNRVHSVIRMAPNQVNQKNAHIVMINNEHNRGARVYPPYSYSSCQFKPGDIVRITAAAHVFKKKYLPQWTEELFKVKSVVTSSPEVYMLEDLSGESIKGTFYAPELQKVTSLPDLFEIEKIVEEKGNKLLVKWKGYPESMNQWIHRGSLRKM